MHARWLIGSVLATGCAVNSPPTSECTSTADCADGQICNTAATCEAPPAPPAPAMARGFTYGDTAGSDESSGGQNEIIALPVAIPTDGVLVGIGFITTQTTGQHMY